MYIKWVCLSILQFNKEKITSVIMEVTHLKPKLKVLEHSIFWFLYFIILTGSGWRKDKESLYFSALNYILSYWGLFIAGILRKIA